MNEWPTWWANVLTVALFTALAFATWRVPRSHVFAEAPSDARWRDIRWWATGLIVLQLGLYGVFT